MESVMALDNRRLGKQRIEALQIYKVLRGESTAWARHPAVTMWKGNEAFLIVYYNAAVCEWSRRGFKNSMPIVAGSVAPAPEWFGGPIHANHRARLLAKNPEFYAEYCWEELPTDINYYPGRGGIETERE
jgi:hypothetical protein